MFLDISENNEEEIEINSLQSFNLPSQADIIQEEYESSSIMESSYESSFNDTNEKKMTKNFSKSIMTNTQSPNKSFIDTNEKKMTQNLSKSLNTHTQPLTQTITKKISTESSKLDINIWQTLIEKINSLLKAQKEKHKNSQIKITNEITKSEIFSSNINENKEKKETNKIYNYVEIDRVAICKNYFEKSNIDLIIDIFNKKNLIISKKFRKSLKKEHFLKLSKYTFFTEKMKNIIENSNKKSHRCSLEKKINNRVFTPTVAKTAKSTEQKNKKSKIALMATRIIKKFKSKFQIKK